jgi:hypothetical protein
MMKDWDLPLLNQPRVTNEALDVLLRDELAHQVEQSLRWEAMRRVAELRRSAGIKPEANNTINIRRPPRYTGTFT